MTFAAEYRNKLKTALDSVDLNQVERLIEVFRKARDEDRQIFVCGNGGSAATANHLACDIVKGASYGRDRRFRIMALSEQIPTMTAYANDVGYEAVFAEQLENFAREGDVLLVLSGSGNSANIVKALETARRKGCFTVALTGRGGGKAGPMADLNINIAEDHMGRIEDAHMVVTHMVGYHFMDTEV